MEKIITVDETEHLLSLFGSYDENIREIENEYGITVVTRGDELKLIGGEEDIDRAAVLHRSENRYGTEAIVLRRAVPAGMTVSPVTIEELFVHMVKGER